LNQQKNHKNVSSSSSSSTSAICLTEKSDLIFLSARPGFLRSRTLALASSMGLGHAAILCGTVTASLAHKLMAARKLANHTLHSSLFPECRLVFVGDSGQADVEFALQMVTAQSHMRAALEARDPASPLRLVPPPLALIHDICGSDQKPLTAQPQRARLRARNIHVFDSYVDAATLCCSHGMLTPAALFAVIDETTTCLSKVKFGMGTNEAQRVARLQEFTLAVRRAHYMLSAGEEEGKMNV
jgi:hypothetical protein